MTEEEATKVIHILCTADEGNESEMLELLNKFARAFPEHAHLARSRWTQETGKEFKVK